MRQLVGVVAWILFASSWAAAQDHVLTVTDADGATGTEATVLVEYDNNSTDQVAGWSIGVCHDVSAVDIVDAVAAATTLTVNGGSPPDFLQINIIPNGDPFIGPGESAGANQSVVISFIGFTTLPPGTDYELFELSYSLDQPGSSTVQMCDTTPGGAFPVSTIVTLAGGASVTATEVDGTLTATGVAAPYVLSFTDPVGLTTTCLLDSSAGDDLSGWSIGICHDTALLDAASATSGATTQTISGGAPPDFEQINLIPNDAILGPLETPGINQAVVIAFLGGVPLPPGSGYELLNIAYDAVGPTGSATIAYCGSTPGGAFTVETVVSESTGISVSPDTETAEIQAGGVAVTFVRGDCNADGVMDLADVVESLEYLFVGGPALPCDDACDANDDGQYDIADAIYNADAMFFGGPPPPAPNPGCGEDPTDDALDCADFPACP